MMGYIFRLWQVFSQGLEIPKKLIYPENALREDFRYSVSRFPPEGTHGVSLFFGKALTDSSPPPLYKEGRIDKLLYHVKAMPP